MTEKISYCLEHLERKPCQYCNPEVKDDFLKQDIAVLENLRDQHQKGGGSWIGYNRILDRLRNLETEKPVFLPKDLHDLEVKIALFLYPGESYDNISRRLKGCIHNLAVALFPYLPSPKEETYVKKLSEIIRMAESGEFGELVSSAGILVRIGSMNYSSEYLASHCGKKWNGVTGFPEQWIEEK
jgi:hypothetical protein